MLKPVAADSKNDDGDVCFDTTSKPIKLAKFPALKSKFTLRVTATVAPKSQGYVLAKTLKNGASAFGLYVSGTIKRVALFYRVPKSTRQFLAMWQYDVTDGKPHAIEMRIDGKTAELRVDDTFSQTLTLRGDIDDCGEDSAACATYLGGRDAKSAFAGLCLAAASINPDHQQTTTAAAKTTAAATAATAAPTAAASTVTKTGSAVGVTTTAAAETTQAATTTTVAATSTVVTTTATTRAVRNSGKTITFDSLLDAEEDNVAIEGEVKKLAGGAGYLFGGGTLKVKAHPASLQQQWSIALDVQQDKGNKGYLFAKTAKNGGKTRYYAMYSRAGLANFYYQDADGNTATTKFSDVTIADGARHSVLVSSSGGNVRLKVDGDDTITKTLAVAKGKPIADCGKAAADCQFYLGQRLASDGSGAEVYRFKGSMFSTVVFPGKSFLDHPTVGFTGKDDDVSAATATDWLDANNHERPGSVLALTGKEKGFVFRGDGLLVTKHQKLSQKFTVAIHVTVIPNSKGCVTCSRTVYIYLLDCHVTSL